MTEDDDYDDRVHDTRIRNTVIILSVSVALMVVMGFTVGIFLLVRANDVQNVQDQIENRVTQSERALCAYMEQRAGIRTTPNDVLLANQAEILIKRYGCETKGSLGP